MKFIVKLIVFTFLFISLLVVPAAIACTTITVSNGEKVMFGGNENSPPNTSSFLVVDTKGTFGVVYFATPWEPWPLIMMSGINEMGLCYHSNWIPGQAEKERPGRIDPLHPRSGRRSRL